MHEEGANTISLLNSVDHVDCEVMSKIRQGLRIKEFKVRIYILSSASCVTLVKLLSLSKSQFLYLVRPQLQNEDNNPNYFIQLFSEIIEKSKEVTILYLLKFIRSAQ